MSNMSYCRFQNTGLDLQDCINALDPDSNEYEISREEVAAGKNMFRGLLEFCESEGIIDGYDEDSIAALFDNHNTAVSENGTEG